MMIDFSIQPGMFAIAGMGALFAASVRSPITGVVLVVEMTQNYSLILPLMITCITSTTVMQLARNQPIYTQLLLRTLNLKVKSSSQG
jgi:CIC family chloride channel protein